MLALLLGAGALQLAVSTAQAAGGNPVTPDPAAPGNLTAVRAEFDLPTKVKVGVGTPAVAPATDPTTLLLMREAGDIYYPGNGAGPFPVLVFQHGNHATCDSGSTADDLLVAGPGSAASYSNGDCSTGNANADAAAQIQEARSYQGYDYLAQRLATQGYIVVSLDVNDITAWTNNSAESGYLARAEIISKTLDLLGTWNTTTGPAGIGDALKGRVGLDKGVGVMGHSRGGEGVNAFAEYNLTRPATAAAAAARVDPEAPTRAQPVPDFGPRYHLKAVFSLAPVDNQGARKPVIAGTNFATLLPYCDGDVYDLEGAPVFERSKDGLTANGYAATQFVVNGANHDYFNTIWTEDDANLFGFGDPNCNAAAAPTRLQPVEERQVGLTLIGGFLRYYVGGETQFASIVRGESLPTAACPNQGEDPVTGVTCRNVVQTSYEAPGRRVLLKPTGTAALPTVPTTTPSGDPITSTGLTLTACTPSTTVVVTTNGCGASPNRSAGPQLGVSWTSAAPLVITPSTANRDISSFATVNFRIAPNYTSAQQLPVEYAVPVTLTDTANKTATVSSIDYSAALEPPAGTSARKQLLNGVRIPLSAFTGVDLTKIKTISLAFGSATMPTGSVQLNDLVLQEPAVVADPTATATATVTPANPTATVTVTQTAFPTATSTATATSTVTAPVPTATVTTTQTVSPTATPTATATSTVTAPVPTATVTTTQTVSPTATPTATATSTVTAPTPTATTTVTQTVSPTATPTATATATVTAPTPTATTTVTQTVSPTATPTATATSTVTAPTPTVTQTVTQTTAPTSTATATTTSSVPQPTATVTVTQTVAATPSPSTSPSTSPTPAPSTGPVASVAAAVRTQTRIRLPNPFQVVGRKPVKLQFQVVGKQVSAGPVGRVTVSVDGKVVRTGPTSVTLKTGKKVSGSTYRMSRRLGPGPHRVQVVFTPTDPAAYGASTSRLITLTVLGPRARTVVNG